MFMVFILPVALPQKERRKKEKVLLGFGFFLIEVYLLGFLLGLIRSI